MEGRKGWKGGEDQEQGMKRERKDEKEKGGEWEGDKRQGKEEWGGRG